jgi:hypothetical protein
LLSVIVGTRSSLVTLVFFVTVIFVPSTSGRMWSSFSGILSVRVPMTTMLGSGGWSSAACAQVANVPHAATANPLRIPKLRSPPIGRAVAAPRRVRNRRVRPSDRIVLQAVQARGYVAAGS